MEKPIDPDFLRQKIIEDWLLQDAGQGNTIDFSRPGQPERALLEKVLNACRNPPEVDMGKGREAYIRACSSSLILRRTPSIG